LILDLKIQAIAAIRHFDQFASAFIVTLGTGFHLCLETMIVWFSLQEELEFVASVSHFSQTVALFP
jgi:hypothetical protein